MFTCFHWSFMRLHSLSPVNSHMSPFKFLVPFYGFMPSNLVMYITSLFLSNDGKMDKTFNSGISKTTFYWSLPLYSIAVKETLILLLALSGILLGNECLWNQRIHEEPFYCLKKSTFVQCNPQRCKTKQFFVLQRNRKVSFSHVHGWPLWFHSYCYIPRLSLN